MRHLLLPATLVAALAACQPARTHGDVPVASSATTSTPPALPTTACNAGSGERCGHFRAVGTEPGWVAIVTLGTRPTLHAELDYGERTYDVTLTAGKDGWSGQAADGSFISLSIRPGACSDGMSDRRWPANAIVLAGDKRYEGCGTYEP